MASGDIKGFFRQKKKSTAATGGIAKLSASSKTKASPNITGTGRGRSAALAGPDPVQPAALIFDGSLDLKDEYAAAAEVLRQFDMDMRYGPCLGMTRMERWDRAFSMALNPPVEVKTLLRSGVGGGGGDGGKVELECLWEGRV